ncbi:MAG: CoB--CoM heterodisulfide reductase iron-sulfur subunit A family protein [Deltaproteobacteria bacterium]|jgi:quinone-modifying oxidoreductase subunit QmoA|nr:CoB--CoM heterodisulfide reductase iron-sulfur subunit A family protein [Deltaproteobacteria bacterium]MBT4087355.1 CoB--CoM heterodisulfide reductase iron-sulfur subunit A family protein [Deltaproteobacteria bacterium]MBT4266981.1 CoB--CoM heterodisulfide reductase iron-sulfur subunit A family protein [Deltaproteobacteria bacterium]MBT4639702.1 CoB--CoM heterodisulfide reductase iron-sulfur subunit A family protein [Deltaproteobacteria bacterium]MBT6504167.1 CoB--CoM heterodisulfide reducta
MAEQKGKILVIGGGISGVSTALEAAEVGYDVILVEKNPSLGGRVSRFYQYFPKLCPPLCGLEINYKRLKPNPYIQTLTNSEVESISGEPGKYQVKITTNPTFVNEKCVICDKCTEVCPSERESEHNYGLDKTKAIFIPHKMAYPARFTIDRDACDPSCSKCVEACEYDAIDLQMQPKTTDIEVAAIVYATGWKPYDANKIDNLGFGKVENVINNVMMERIAHGQGPTQGQLLRPSDQKKADSIAFVQCAGSRDENHLPYCSAVCCLASLKQARYARLANPDAKIYIFYIDIRSPGKYEDFATEIQKDENIIMVKGKVAKVTQGQGGNVVVEAEDILNGGKVSLEVDMVVLATGMESSMKGANLPDVVQLDENGFVAPNLQNHGILSAGVAKFPGDVNSSIQDSTGAALKAIQTVVGN